MTDCPWLGDFVVVGMDSSGMGFCFFFASSFYLLIDFLPLMEPARYAFRASKSLLRKEPFSSLWHTPFVRTAM